MHTHLRNDWLERQAEASARHLLSIDPALLSPVGRSLLPAARKLVEIPDNVVHIFKEK